MLYHVLFGARSGDVVYPVLRDRFRAWLSCTLQIIPRHSPIYNMIKPLAAVLAAAVATSKVLEVRGSYLSNALASKSRMKWRPRIGLVLTFLRLLCTRHSVCEMSCRLSGLEKRTSSRRRLMYHRAPRNQARVERCQWFRYLRMV